MSARDVDKWTPTRSTVEPLRSAQDTRAFGSLDDYFGRVQVEVARLLAEYPHLEGQPPEMLFSRMAAPETLVQYESALRRAAFAVLHLRAVDRREHLDFTSGGDAA